MRAHVPGPWRLESETRGPEGDELLITDARGDVNIACALFAARDSGCCDYEEAAKNACLIAAAPALLTALRNIVHEIEAGEKPNLQALEAACESARSAIAAAEDRVP